MEEFTMTANPGVSVDAPASAAPAAPPSPSPIPAPESTQAVAPVPTSIPQPSPAPTPIPAAEPAPTPAAPQDLTSTPLVESVAPQTMSTEAKPPSKSFRAIFLLLLLATLASAGATAYILMSGNKPQVVPQPAVTQVQTKDENPFAAETEITNPFVDTVSAAAIVTPFDDATVSENPFDQFATNDATPVTNTNKSQNPF